MSPRSTFPFLCASFVLASTAAHAADPAAAQALYDDAKQLMAQGRYTEACPKLEESQRNDAGLGTQFHLADCWQHLGRSASAWALFREVESGARALGQTSRERVAHDRAVALEPWVSKIIIAPHDAAEIPEIHILRDGVEVGREQWDVPVPVDPGTHVVAATAPRKQPWETSVVVLSEGKVMTVDVPPLADIEEPSIASQPAQAAAPAEPSAAPPSRGVTSPMPTEVRETAVLEDHGATQRAIGWTLVGAGVVGLTAGVYFGAQWIDDRSQVDAHCSGNTCDATGASMQHDARTQALRAEWVLGAGAATFLIGAVVVATAPRPRIVVGAASLEIAPVLGPQTGGLAVHGAW